MKVTERPRPLGLSFALCPGCDRMRAVVWRSSTGRYRTRRHGACGVVDLPADVVVRPL